MCETIIYYAIESKLEEKKILNMKLLLRLFSANWKTWFFWGAFITAAHILGYFFDQNFINQYLPRLGKDKTGWGSNDFINTIIGAYATIYGVGVPLIVTLLENKLDLKNQISKDKIIHHSEIRFFVIITPMIIIYALSLSFFVQGNDFHVAILFFISCYSFFRLYRLADFCLAVFNNTSDFFNNEFRNRTNEILEEI